MVNDFRDGSKWYLDDFAVGDLHLEAWRRQGLCCFHAANDTAHPAAVRRHDLYVVLTIERLECCEGFGYFHFLLPRFLKCFDFAVETRPKPYKGFREGRCSSVRRFYPNRYTIACAPAKRACGLASITRPRGAPDVLRSSPRTFSLSLVRAQLMPDVSSVLPDCAIIA